MPDFQEADDYYQAWEPPFLSLRAIGIYCIIKLESHHYIVVTIENIDMEYWPLLNCIS